MVARLPNIKKSYHSIRVPAQDADRMERRLFLFVGVYSNVEFFVAVQGSLLWPKDEAQVMQIQPEIETAQVSMIES